MQGKLLGRAGGGPGKEAITWAPAGVAEAEQIRAVQANAVIEIGRHLIEAKDRVGHGHFLPWLDREFGWDERTAQRIMAVFERFGNTQRVADLPVTRAALYLLAGRGSRVSASRRRCQMTSRPRSGLRRSSTSAMSPTMRSTLPA